MHRLDDELDIDNFNVPNLSTDDPIKRIRDNSKNLTLAIQAAQTTVRTMRHRHMAYDYDKQRIHQDVKTIRARAFDFYQGLAKSMRVTFWVVFVFVCLIVAAFVRHVTPL